MKLIISTINILILSFISTCCFGQIFDSEQSPLSVRWRQIHSNGFKLIYPSELEGEAQRMANTITKIYPQIGSDLGLQKTRLPIVFQNRGTIANGFVQLAPKKSQFYTTPPQQFDSQDWLNNLAVHELRHVAQFGKITGRESFFLSEEIHFAYIGLSTPTWFLEGDAVSTETSLTDAGRGRQPSWIMPFRAALLSGKKFSYSKSYFGSEKDLTPGYYQLGYLLTSNMKKQYGNGIVNKLLSDINQRPLRPYPFSSSLKKLTGENTSEFYQSTISKLRADWETQDRLNQSEDYAHLNAVKKYAGSYFLPTGLPNGQILALKQTKAEAPNFVLVSSDKSETKLFRIGYQEQQWYTYGNGKMVWDEIRYDPRYRQRSYSVICIYDMATKSKRQLTSKSRLFSPAISGDGKKLVAIQIDLGNHSSLVAIDLETGKTTTIYANPNHLILQTPALNQHGDEIAFIGVSEKGKSLWLLKSGNAVEQIIAESKQQLSRPIFLGPYIAFNAHYSGIDNVYGINAVSKKIVALTASKYGAFNPGIGPDGKSFYFNDYDWKGLHISRTSLQERPLQHSHFVYFGNPAAGTSVFTEIPDSSYTSKKYSPLAHLLNFHSLSLAVDDDDRLALRLKSNDLLNIFDLYAGIGYDNELRKLEYQAGLAVKALYPVLSITAKNRARQAYYRLANNIYRADWRENVLDLKASVPLSFSAYQHNYSIVGEIGTSYTERHFAPAEASRFNSTVRFPMSYRFGVGHSVRMAERDIAPKWAQSVGLSYFNQPFDQNLNGDLIAFESLFYFPGIGRNHSLMASFNYQKSSGILSFNNEINTVWGYNQLPARSELRNTFLLNYRFPIAFLDAEIGRLAYIRNLKGGFFSHYENIGTETDLTQPKTFGLELRSQLNLLRYQPIVDLGARLIFSDAIYRHDPMVEFTFNYSF